MPVSLVAIPLLHCYSACIASIYNWVDESLSFIVLLCESNIVCNALCVSLLMLQFPCAFVLPMALIST